MGLERKAEMIYISDIIYGLPMRTLVDLDEEDVARLDEIAASSKQSRAALIRRAIADFLGQHKRGAVNDAFGLWGKGKADGLAYQRKVRSEW